MVKAMFQVELMSQVIKSPAQLVCAETGFVLSTSLQPSEILSDADPPGWSKRNETWTIEELLGLYDSKEAEITIFSKGITYTAEQLQVNPFFVEYVVRIHEWAHAGFHLGVDQGKCAELARAGLNNDESAERVTRDRLIGVYSAVDVHVHEQISQSITWLALEKLRANATSDEAKEACVLLLNTFKALTLRQPERYQLEKVQNIERNQLQSRLRDLIALIRDGSVQGNQKMWDTLMRW